MKLSHLSMIAGMLIVISCLQWSLKFQMLQKASYTRFCYNQIVDNAIEDGLCAGVVQENTLVPYVDEEKAIEGFEQSLLRGFGVLEGSAEADKLLSCVGCIVILQAESFTVYAGDTKETFPYSAAGNTVANSVEEQVQKALKKRFPKRQQYLIDFPEIEEEACHTLQGVSMISFMQYDEYSIDGFACNRYTLSGARLESEK